MRGRVDVVVRHKRESQRGCVGVLSGVLTKLMALFAGTSPRGLVLRAHLGDRAGVEKLLDAGISPSCIEISNTPLIAALVGNHADVVDLLLRRGATPEDVFNVEEGATVLHALAQMPVDDALAARVLDAARSPDARSKIGVTPLMLAAGAGRLSFIKALIARGADVDAVVSGTFPLTSAPFDSHGTTPLVCAIRGRDDAAVDVLVDAGARLCARMNDGFTELTVACFVAHRRIVEQVIALGADVNAPMGEGRLRGLRPLMIPFLVPPALTRAAPHEIAVTLVERQNIVHALVAAGADVDARDGEGKSVRDYAAPFAGTPLRLP